MATYKIKRAYEPPSGSDGYRVLVDRLWPRGVSKERLALDLWLKDIAPSSDLRKWFGHDTAKFKEFKARYLHELKTNPAVDRLKKIQAPEISLIYGARDEENNHAVVLKQFLDKS